MRNIKDKVIKLCNKRVIDYIIIIIIGIFVSIQLNKVQISVGTHDGIVHLMRIKGAINAINIHEFPPLIVPDMCMSSGYAMILFYNPIVTYLPLLLYVLIRDYFISMKLFAIICIMISGITMYHFTYQVTKKRLIALISAVLYINVPYLLGNIYVRFAMGEFTALAFMPLTFIGLYNLINQDGEKHYFISIGAILVLLSHTITGFYLAIFCFIYLLINLRKLKNFYIIKKLIINILFIIIITMFFWTPIFEAKNAAEYGIFDNILMGTNSNYSAKRAVDLKTFIYGDDYDDYPTILILGIPTIILSVLTIYVCQKVDKDYKKIYIIFIAFSIISLFMTTKYFPWNHMPNILCKLQFPWRMLGFFGFFSSFICAINLYIVLEKNLSKKYIKTILLMLIFTYISIYSIHLLNIYIVKNEDGFIDSNLNEQMDNQELFLKIINTEYLPLKLLNKENERKYILNRKDYCLVLKGKAHILDEKKDNLSLTLKLENVIENTEIEFPFIFYPGYKITINEDGKTTSLKSYESENGYVAVKIDKNIENAEIKVEYKGTLLTKVSYFISFLGLICFIIFIWKEKNKLMQNTTQISENMLK